MNKIKFYFPQLSPYIFGLIFFSLFFVYDLQEISFLRPQSVHQWRQCDCLAFSQNYYQDGNSFWQPQMNYLGSDNTGKTVSDFPLIYYSVAQLWKFFGYHEYIYRLLILFFAFWGLFALFKNTEDLFQDSFWGLFMATFLFSSTIFVYYADNFLMNVPSFSLALIALYLFYLFIKSRKKLFWYISLCTFLLAALLKIPALTSFVAIIFYYFLEITGIIPSDKQIFNKKIEFGLSFFIVLIPIALWYLYAAHYNDLHNKGIFLIGILPIWEYTRQQISHVYNYAWILWSESYHSRFSQYLSMLFLLFLIFRFKKWNFKLRVFTLTLWVGFMAFIILWYQVFDNHDYYLINQLIFLLFIYVSFLFYLKENHPKIFRSNYLKIFALIFIVYNVHVCRENIHLRYHGWPNKQHIQYFKACENIEPFLEQQHIMRQDTLLVLNDHSFNISLDLMNRKGWTNCLSNLRDSSQIAERVSAGAGYLFINDSTYLKKKYLQPFMHHPLAQYKNIHIFILK